MYDPYVTWIETAMSDIIRMHELQTLKALRESGAINAGILDLVFRELQCVGPGQW